MARLASTTDELTFFPGGPVPKSMVHEHDDRGPPCYYDLDENGVLTRRCSRTDKQLSFNTNPTDDAMEFDETRRTSRLYRTDKIAKFAEPVPGPPGAGWHLRVYKNLEVGKKQITRLYGRQWVPTNPATNTGLIYYFNGLTAGLHIIQPVLTWDAKKKKYTLADYFISPQNPKVKSRDVDIYPNSWVYPVVTGRYSTVYGFVYNTYFATSLNGSKKLTAGIEIRTRDVVGFTNFNRSHLGVLEAYLTTQCADLGYPFMFDNTVLEEDYIRPSGAIWTGGIDKTSCGQTLTIKTNTNPGARVDFRPTTSRANGAPSIVWPIPW